jgi:ClpP class serine protease
MDRARFADVVGRENICDNVLDALARVDGVGDVFTSMVATRRKLSVDAVLAYKADAYTGGLAKDAGLIDDVCSIEDAAVS